MSCSRCRIWRPRPQRPGEVSDGGPIRPASRARWSLPPQGVRPRKAHQPPMLELTSVRHRAQQGRRLSTSHATLAQSSLGSTNSSEQRPLTLPWDVERGTSALGKGQNSMRLPARTLVFDGKMYQWLVVCAFVLCARCARCAPTGRRYCLPFLLPRQNSDLTIKSFLMESQ